jgi:predicted PurR-regulated permease PerM
MWLFLAFIFASALDPVVNFLHKLKMPRALSIGVMYVVLIAILSVLFGLTIPPLVKQTALLISTFSRLLGISDYSLEQFTRIDFSNLTTSLDQYVLQYQSVLGQLQGSITTVVNIIFSTFSVVFVLFTLLITTFYFLMNMDKIAVSFAWLLPGEPEAQAKKARHIMDMVQVRLGQWISGQLTLMFIIGVVTFIGLSLLGVPFALPLALLAGLLEIIPNVGPTIAAVPSISIAFFMLNPFMGVIVLLFHILVQQLENNFVVPMIMKEAVDVRPLTTLLLILVGFELFGVAGALLVVPLYITVRTFVQELWPQKGPFVDYTKYLPKSQR